MNSLHKALALAVRVVIVLSACSFVPAQQTVAGKSGGEPPAKAENPASGDISLKPSESAKTETSTTEDLVESRQSFNTFTSLEDGQPGQPGEFQINYTNGWETTSGEADPWLMNTELQYTFKNEVLRNTKLGIALPMELGNGGYQGNGDINFEWIQRWLSEKDGEWWPTLSTVNVVRLPTGYESSGVDWTLTGVAAKDLGPGTAYFNAFIKSANGHNNLEEASWADEVLCGEESDDLRNFQWGFRWGYKWRVADNFALIADYVLQSSEDRGHHNLNIGEISAEWRINEHLSLGPGIMVGLDGAEETPNFAAGITLHYEIE